MPVVKLCYAPRYLAELPDKPASLKVVWVRRAGVKRLQKLGMVSAVPGMSALDMNSAEDAVVNHTREVVPGMVICGMEARPPGAAPNPVRVYHLRT